MSAAEVKRDGRHGHRWYFGAKRRKLEAKKHDNPPCNICGKPYFWKDGNFRYCKNHAPIAPEAA